MLNVSFVSYVGKLLLKSELEDRPNWQDWGARWSRRNGFMKHLKTSLEELEITYLEPIQPVLLPSNAMSAMLSPQSPTRLRRQPSNISMAQRSPSSVGNGARLHGAEYFRRAPGRHLEPGESSFASGQTAVDM